MKKVGKMFALMTVLLMALAACSTAIDDETAPMSDGTTEEATMEKDTMEETEEHGSMDDDMEKEDMSDDSMEKEDMSDDSMDKEDMSDDGMDKDAMENDTMGEDMAMMNDGEPAPAFSLMNLDGETVSLADFEGEKVYVKYWASWCSICVGGLPGLDELAGMDNDFEIITIVTPGFGGEKNAQAFKEWFASKGTENLTVLLDTDGTYAKAFGVRGFPTSAYIGSDGVLVKTAPGHVGNDVVVAAFEDIK